MPKHKDFLSLWYISLIHMVFANPNGYVLLWVELFASWSKRDGWGSTCFGSLKSCCFCTASKKIVNRQKVICLFLRVKRKTCEEDLAGETAKVGFLCLLKWNHQGRPRGKFLGFGSSCPFSLPAIELSNWKNTSFCSLLVLPPVLTAELNVLGFLWCEQDLPLGKVGGGWKREQEEARSSPVLMWEGHTGVSVLP